MVMTNYLGSNINQDMAIREIKELQLKKNGFGILRLRDVELPLRSKTYIMGVLNVTPDSFYDGGKFVEVDRALRHIDEMISEGADIIDIGGESTRPGSREISEHEELRRVIPVIKEAVKRFNVPLSIDTTKARVAEEALEVGVSMVNDISGLKFEPMIADMVSKHGAALVLMHTTSRPVDMQRMTKYESLIDDIVESLRISIVSAESKGVHPNSILIDPGFGFGKTTKQNLYILKELNRFNSLRKPILIGTSRKSFIGEVIGSDKLVDRLEGTAATIAIGIMNGASIVRVHDVLSMKRVSTVVDAVLDTRL